MRFFLIKIGFFLQYFWNYLLNCNFGFLCWRRFRVGKKFLGDYLIGKFIFLVARFKFRKAVLSRWIWGLFITGSGEVLGRRRVIVVVVVGLWGGSLVCVLLEAGIFRLFLEGRRNLGEGLLLLLGRIEDFGGGEILRERTLSSWFLFWILILLNYYYFNIINF